MKKNQLIIKAIMALALMMCGSNLAYAQFGSLKNVIKREATKQVNDAKRKATHDILREKNEAERKEREAAKQKAEEAAKEAAAQEATSVSETTSQTTSNSPSASAEPKKSIHNWVDASYYKKAKHVEWDYTSSMRDVVNDMAYWCKRLRASAETGDKSQLDMEALERLTTGRPSFDYADKEYTDGMVNEFELGSWQSERRALVKAATEIRDGVELDVSWKILESNDEEKALKKEITTELHKATLLKRYKEAAQMNSYGKAISGNDAWVTKIVKENCPEWGKVLASKINTNYKVNYSGTVPKSRYHTAVVMCEDQGYKVLHYIQLSQPYNGGGKYGSSHVRDGGMKWSAMVELVK